MPVSISDGAKVHELVARIARITGEDPTAIVIRALESRLNQVSPKSPEQKRADVLRMLREWEIIPIADARPIDEILYDDRGLPK